MRIQSAAVVLSCCDLSIVGYRQCRRRRRRRRRCRHVAELPRSLSASSFFVFSHQRVSQVDIRTGRKEKTDRQTDWRTAAAILRFCRVIRVHDPEVDTSEPGILFRIFGLFTYSGIFFTYSVVFCADICCRSRIP